VLAPDINLSLNSNKQGFPFKQTIISFPEASGLQQEPKLKKFVLKKEQYKRQKEQFLF